MKNFFVVLAAILFISCDNGTSSSSNGSKNGGNNPPSIAPTVSIFAATDAFLVSWNAVEEATGYYVYSSSSLSGTYTKSDAENQTSMIFDGLASGTTKYFKVSAYNKHGESESSSVISGTTQSSGGGGSGGDAGCAAYQTQINEYNRIVDYLRKYQQETGYDQSMYLDSYRELIARIKSDAKAAGCSIN